VVRGGGGRRRGRAQAGNGGRVEDGEWLPRLEVEEHDDALDGRDSVSVGIAWEVGVHLRREHRATAPQAGGLDVKGAVGHMDTQHLRRDAQAFRVCPKRLLDRVDTIVDPQNAGDVQPGEDKCFP
jgi:hypothetical protein